MPPLSDVSCSHDRDEAHLPASRRPPFYPFSQNESDFGRVARSVVGMFFAPATVDGARVGAIGRRFGDVAGKETDPVETKNRVGRRRPRVQVRGAEKIRKKKKKACRSSSFRVRKKETCQPKKRFVCSMGVPTRCSLSRVDEIFYAVAKDPRSRSPVLVPCSLPSLPLALSFTVSPSNWSPSRSFPSAVFSSRPANSSRA